MKVLEFNYHIIELKKKNWRNYIKSNNPVAAALLSKMGYNEKEKVEIKIEFLRMITRMQIDMAKKTLITGFFETYLRLDSEEEKELEKRIRKLNPKEAEEMLELTTSWHEKGRQEGIEKGLLAGKREMAKNMLSEGEAMEKVIKYTGLEKEEVSKLKKELEG